MIAAPAEEVARLFQPFQRLQRGRTRHTAGHGLGLAIVQVIANAHRARVDARPIAAGGLDISVCFALAAHQAVPTVARDGLYHGQARTASVQDA
jgi:signal transduction histidine kinase